MEWRSNRARSMWWVGAAGLALAIGYAVPADTYMAALGGSVVLVAALLFFAALVRAPAAGPMLLLIVAVLMPMEVSVGSTTIGACVPLTIALCGASLLRRALSSKPIGVDISPVAVAVVVFMGVAVLAFVAGQYPWFTAAPAPLEAQLGGLALFLMSGGLFIVVGYDIRSLVHLERLTWLFVGAGGCAVVLGMLPAPVSSYIDLVLKSDSLGSIFWTWFVAVGVSQGLCNRQLSTMKRAGLLAISGLALARGLLLAFSWASGWLPPLVALGTIVLFRFPRLTTTASALAIAPALFLRGPLMSHVMAGENYSLMTRTQAFRVLWEVIQRDPWIGFGPANYYHYTLLYPILGWYVRFSSHNNYLDLIAQTGVVGLLAFIWFVFEVIRLTARLLRRRPAGFAQAYLVGVLGGLAGSLVSGLLADWIIPFVYNIGLRGFRSSLLLWLFLGGVLALRNMTMSAVSTSAAVAGPGVAASLRPSGAWT